MRKESKAKKVREMFALIAPRYDLLNRLLSFKRDQFWRNQAVDELLKLGGTRYLDVATGTADIPLVIAGKTQKFVKIAGIDFTPEMLFLAHRKLLTRLVSERVFLACGDGQFLPYQDDLFDGAIVAFGVRNFSDLRKGIKEMRRVVKKEGKLVILEFTHPSGPIFKPLYHFYFNYILPFIGGMISGNSEAYRYLPESVAGFPDKEGLKEMMTKEGFKEVYYYPLTFGIAAIHIGIK